MLRNNLSVPNTCPCDCSCENKYLLEHSFLWSDNTDIEWMGSNRFVAIETGRSSWVAAELPYIMQVGSWNLFTRITFPIFGYFWFLAMFTPWPLWFQLQIRQLQRVLAWPVEILRGHQQRQHQSLEAVSGDTFDGAPGWLPSHLEISKCGGSGSACCPVQLARLQVMKLYADITGDHDGVETVEGKTRGKCWDGGLRLIFHDV